MNRKTRSVSNGIANAINLDEEFSVAVDLVSELIDDEVKYHFRSPIRLLKQLKVRFLYIIKLIFTIIFLTLQKLTINPITRNLAALISSVLITILCFILIFFCLYWFLSDVLSFIDMVYHYFADVKYHNKEIITQLHDNFHKVESQHMNV